VAVTACSERVGVEIVVSAGSEVSLSQPVQAEPPVQSQSESSSEEPLSSEEETPIPYNAVVEKYYDYFRENGYVGWLKDNGTGDEGFSDANMVVYALLELIKLSDLGYKQEIGFPKEEIDAVIQKYFGTTVSEYKSKWIAIIPETGNITSTGWGGGSSAFVLKELETDSDGICTAIFYAFGFDMGDYLPTLKEDLLRYQFEDYGQPSLVKMVFEEKTDEDGKMYLRYHEVKSEGAASPPYEAYQG
jgi:hypothetical protein